MGGVELVAQAESASGRLFGRGAPRAQRVVDLQDKLIGQVDQLGGAAEVLCKLAAAGVLGDLGLVDERFGRNHTAVKRRGSWPTWMQSVSWRWRMVVWTMNLRRAMLSIGTSRGSTG